MDKEVPVAILACSRPEKLHNLVASLNQFGIRNIYVSCDGAPNGRKNEHQETVRLILSLKEKGEIRDYRISDTNRGLLFGITDGISWFFDKFEIGAILEDDIVLEHPLLHILKKGAEILKENEEIASINLFNLSKEKSSSTEPGFYICHFPVSWAWMTSKTNWQKLIIDINTLPNLFETLLFPECLSRTTIKGIKRELKLRIILESKHIWTKDWDIRWFYTMLVNSWKVVSVYDNPFRYDGWGVGSSHTFVRPRNLHDLSSRYTENSTMKLTASRSCNRNAELFYFKRYAWQKQVKSAFRFRTRLRSWSKVNLQKG